MQLHTPGDGARDAARLRGPSVDMDLLLQHGRHDVRLQPRLTRHSTTERRGATLRWRADQELLVDMLVYSCVSRVNPASSANGAG